MSADPHALEGTSIANTILPPAALAYPMSSEDLIVLVAQRYEPALGALYDRYGQLVYTVALRITGNRQTTEEVVQDVFQNIWHSAGGFQSSVGSFSSWLMGIARHRAIDATRSRRERARSREEQLTIDIPADESKNSIEDEVSRRLLRDEVQVALRTLPTSQRQTIELAYYAGLTRAEIAELLGEPLGTVKTRLRLGLMKLRDSLREK